MKCGYAYKVYSFLCLFYNLWMYFAVKFSTVRCLQLFEDYIEIKNCPKRLSQ
jgi:hypothetical protein